MSTAAGSDVRSRRRDQTRQEILAAAWRLAEQDGIASLSLRDLALQVGMRAPSLYTYFDSKAAIYDEMFASGYRQLDEALNSFEVDTQDPVGSLARGMESFVVFCSQSPARYQLMFTRAVPEWEPSSDAYAVSLASYAGMADRLTRLGIDGERGLDLLTAITAGLAAQQLANDPGGDRWQRLSREAAEMFVAYAQR